MAGLYPDVPAPRMAYDLDGSVGFYASSDGTTVGLLSTDQLKALNDETAGDALTGVPAGSQYYVGVIFPTLRDLNAFTPVGTLAQPRDFQVSTDTTNGYDGTWTVVQSGFFPVGDTGSYLRTGIITLSAPATGVKACRIAQASGIDSFHLYGSLTAGQTLDKLQFWDPVLDQPLDLTPAFFDYAEVNRGSSDTSKQFRLKNLSPTLTATDVIIRFDVPTDASPSLLSQFTFDAGSGPSPVINIGNIAAGQTSAAITVDRNQDFAAQLGLFYGRIVAAAGSWS